MIIKHPNQSLIPALQDLWQEAFGDTDAFWNAFTATAMSPSRCFAATEDGRLAGALYWFDCACGGKPVAYLYGVATAKIFRGRGVCHALMAHLHRHLQEKGYAGVILVPGGESLFQFYGDMGYQTFCAMEDLPCAPGEAIAPVHPVDAPEYARLRRQLLPEGGVVQEGENLDFLTTQADLYAGPGFVLAAQKEGRGLLGLELLGDRAVAPGILTALDCAEGTFRVFGSGSPFAMYRPLNPAPAPTYFAFAFD